MFNAIESQVVGQNTVELIRFNAGGQGSSYRVEVNHKTVFEYKNFGYQENYKAYEAIVSSLLLAS